MEKRAKSVENAVELALAELGVTRDKVNVEIIDEGAKGFLGIGAKEAIVNVTLKEAAKEAAKEAPKAPKKEAAKPVKKEVKKEIKKEITEETERKPRAKREIKPLTPDEAKEACEKATEFLNSVFESMSLDVKVNAALEGEDTILVKLDGENIGIVIGKRGDTLDALQYLTSLVVNKKTENYIKVTLDTENYREKRNEALLGLSQRLAAKVARTGKKYTLEPMNPYERRIIHSALQSSEEVTTYSIGQEPYRKVVIAPKNAKPRKPRSNGPRKSDYAPKTEETAELKGSYTTTYKADFKPQQHKAQYASFEEYLAAQTADK